MTAAKLPRELRMIYREIPTSSPCKPGCSDCCGPVPWSSAELARVQSEIPITAERIALDHMTVLMDPQTGSCPFVAEGGGCKVYERRPFICRLFSSSVESPMLRCPHGACPACPMSAAKASALTKRYHAASAALTKDNYP